MSKLSGSVLFRYFIGASVAYFIASLILPSQLLIAVAKLVNIIVSCLVVATWGPSGIRELREGRVQGGTILLVGIAGQNIYSVAYQVLTLVSRGLNMPDYLVNTPPIGYLVAGMAGFSMLFLIAPEVEQNGPPQPAKLWWFVLGVLAAGVLGYMFGASGQ